MIEHENRAWFLSKLDPEKSGQLRWSMGVWGPRVYMTTDEETARRIHGAINSHDDLLTSLRECLGILEIENKPEWDQQVIETARAVIAKAEEKS